MTFRLIEFSLSQLLIRIKITTIIIYFKKNVYTRIYRLLKELTLKKQAQEKSVMFVTICDICYFLNSFKFQPIVCNRCHDSLVMSIYLNDIAILNIKGSDYRCIISLIRKNEVINLMENVDLTEKSGTLQNIRNSPSCIKMGKGTLTFDTIEIEKNKFYCDKTLILVREQKILRGRFNS